MKEYKEILFKEVEDHGLYMDIYVPDDAVNPPIIMWVHGGGWSGLNRKWCLVTPQFKRGYAIALVDYRYCDEAPFPEVMKDLKDALLFIKKHGSEYGYDASKVIVSGDSAGGHLSSVLAVSAGNSDWEQLGEDYSVQALVDFCGPVSFTDLIPKNPEDRSPVGRVTWHALDAKGIRVKAAEASAETYINGNEPPVLIIHGTKDPMVNPSQAKNFRNALEAAGDTVHMYFVPGGVHGMSGELLDGIVAEFLDYYIKGKITNIEPMLAPIHDRTVPVKEYPFK